MIKKQKKPIVTWFILISCIITYLFQIGIIAPPNIVTQYLLPFSRYAFDNNLYFCAITYAWMHASIMHLLSNMLLLLSVSKTIEKSYGHIAVIFIYLFGAICGAIAFAILRPVGDPITLVGASGAIFALVGAYLIMLITTKHSKYATHEQKVELSHAIRSTIYLVVWNLVYGLFLTSGVSNAAHIGGFLSGIITGILVVIADSISQRTSKTQRPNQTQNNAYTHKTHF